MRKPLRILFTSVLMISLFSSLILPIQINQAASTTVVISEFRTRGPNGGNDEFIELYNLSSTTVNISGWEIRASNASGTVTTRAVIQPGTSLNPGCKYLLTNSNPTGGPYSGSVSGNQTYGVGITDDGGIALTQPGGAIVDQVGLSSGSAFKEGGTLSPLTSSSNRSYERKPGGGAGSDQDTDNNSFDFHLLSPSDPDSATSACTGTGSPSNPTGVGASNPSTVEPGNSTLMTVAVSLGQNPISTNLNVVADLSSINGSANQQLFDNGANGDVIASDNIFSFQVTIPAGVIQGSKLIPVTITDAQARNGSTSIPLNVGAVPPPFECGVERWSVKTGTDPEANLINLTQRVPTTIQIMRGWPAPNPIPLNSRVAPFERTVYAVAGTLTDYRREEDSDYHLVIRDAAENTIIAKSVCPCCVDSTTPFQGAIEDVREDVNTRLNVTQNFQTANIPVIITGVGFFGIVQGQRGVAPNGIELHPILSIRFVSDLTTPVIFGAEIKGKNIIVSGVNFDSGAKLLIDNIAQKTKNDATPSISLTAKKAAKKLSAGIEVILQVRNKNGSLSNGISFTK